MDDDVERSERVRGFRDELFQNLRRAYEQRRPAPDLSLQLLRQAAEGLCYCMLLAKNRLGPDQRLTLDELMKEARPFLKADGDAFTALRDWGNKASHAQGRPETATTEVATAVFLLTANPTRWLCREILRQEVPADVEERYKALNLASRVPVFAQAPSQSGEQPSEPKNARSPDAQTFAVGSPAGGGQKAGARVLSGTGIWLTVLGVSVVVFAASLMYLFVPKNDGTDPARPGLAESDHGFVDSQGGWGWGGRCWNNIKAQRWGWAKAECDEGMKMNPLSPVSRASLLYNEGLIAKAGGHLDEARKDFVESLTLRENSEVRAALNSLPP